MLDVSNFQEFIWKSLVVGKRSGGAIGKIISFSSSCEKNKMIYKLLKISFFPRVCSNSFRFKHSTVKLQTNL
ncbi:hypothetical protein BpHYR1_036990 [Brachionus plicatilis]|uniref:Uncharacterized protein n=1 Tax=Brachionus plicatilis TaxID=10195 RepID=A0A3M7SY13_BRAPC|nr:hypothetical protein BpHYR1_036990 [Brachionus plicatilis]